MIDFAAVTDAGRVRSENQDRWFADAELGLFVVADGLGGHAAGGLGGTIGGRDPAAAGATDASAPPPTYPWSRARELPSPPAPLPSTGEGRRALTSGPSPRGKGGKFVTTGLGKICPTAEGSCARRLQNR